MPSLTSWNLIRPRSVLRCESGRGVTLVRAEHADQRKVQLDPRDIARAVPVPAHTGAAEREVTRADEVEDEITTRIKVGAHAWEGYTLTA